MILTEKDREKEGPAVTTVRTTGLLLESPMSTYTKHQMGVGCRASDWCRVWSNYSLTTLTTTDILSCLSTDLLCAPELVPHTVDTGTEPPVT